METPPLLPGVERAEIAAGYHTIPVLFENEDVLAVDKPAGLASIPERNPGKISLLRILTEARQAKLFVVHRLDKQVSGVILFARNAEAHRSLNAQFERRLVKKTYLALVHGVIEGKGGTIDTPLRKFGSGRMGADAGRGKACTTEFAVIERMGPFTLVRVHPLTGRKHQIRAHFFGSGHPVVGDTLYGDKLLQKTYPRLMLHSLNIRFTGLDGCDVSIESPIPESFAGLLDKLRGKFS